MHLKLRLKDKMLQLLINKENKDKKQTQKERKDGPKYKKPKNNNKKPIS